jgi:methionyl-tRNA synthetase
VRTYGLDPLRYFVLREVPFGGDGDFRHQAVIARLDRELANDLGNLAQRTLALVARNCGGQRPAGGLPTEDDLAMRESASALPALVRDAMDRQALGDALEQIWKLIRAANGYIDRQAPWALKKNDPARMGPVLRLLMDLLQVIGTLLSPFMPGSMARLLDQLGVALDGRSIVALGTSLAPGEALPAPVGIFPRFVEKQAAAV